MATYEEKMKALKSALTQIEKEFGKGTVMKMSEKPAVDVDVISSGSIKLDRVLGIGGYPKGRIVEIFGPESGGKCLTEGNMVLTTTGYKTIREIFKENGLEMYTTQKTVEVRYPLINMNGEIEYTTHFTYNGKKDVLCIKTKQGTVIECTKNHPLRVLTNNGYIVWKKANEISNGDILIGVVNTQQFGNNEDTSAYLVGLLTADGSYQTNRILWSNDDKSLIDKFENDVSENVYLSNTVKRNYIDDRSGSTNIHLSGADMISKFYQEYGLKCGRAKDKIVPEKIKRGTKLTQIEFLKGYFDCESYISNQRGIEVASASYELLSYVRLMLKNLGIQSSLYKKLVEKYPENEYYRLSISGEDIYRFINVVGTRSKKVELRYEDFINSRVQKTNETIPNIGNMCIAFYDDIDPSLHESKYSNMIMDIKSKKINISKESLHKLIELGTENNQLYNAIKVFDNNIYVYETVSSIEEIGSLPTYDFAMEKTHSFICEGIINHNTTMALHAIAECQKKGGIAAFIDAEHALDPTYARAIGVDVDNMFICQPESGEQALEVADKLIQSGAIDICVVDSVAALVPKKELEGDMGDVNVGLQARLMSQALRKLTASVSKNNCLMIFINQIREKVGVMFGNPETTAGGRALKFYSSVRMDVRRSETIKDGGEAVSNKVKIKVVKNKVAPPFKEAVVTIQFGKGLDLASEVIDMSVDNGEIIKSGSWFSLKDGERIGQGAENAKKYLNEHPDVMSKLLNIIKNNGTDEKFVNDCTPTSEELNEQNKSKLDIDIIDE